MMEQSARELGTSWRLDLLNHQASAVKQRWFGGSDKGLRRAMLLVETRLNGLYIGVESGDGGGFRFGKEAA